MADTGDSLANVQEQINAMLSQEAEIELGESLWHTDFRGNDMDELRRKTHFLC